MKKGGLFTFLFILFFVIILSLLVFGMVFFIGRGIGVFLSSIELSPLEDEVLIDNSDKCVDSDGGIFFKIKGEVRYKLNFLFLSFVREESDECDGNELNEYYCSSEGVVKGIVECENGCSGGSCLVV